MIRFSREFGGAFSSLPKKGGMKTIATRDCVRIKARFFISTEGLCNEKREKKNCSVDEGATKKNMLKASIIHAEKLTRINGF